jgi:hypothetical protein
VGSIDPATKDVATDQIVRLQNLYHRAHAAGLSTDEFGEAANHHGCVYRISDSAWTRRTDGISSRPHD